MSSTLAILGTPAVRFDALKQLSPLVEALNIDLL